MNMEQLNYETELEKAYKQIENNKPTVRIMSIVFFDEKIYFQTSTKYSKFKQISENNNVALCILKYSNRGCCKYNVIKVRAYFA
jgi:uncharacterized pyridoxamine 5'-phosphate oxidase family protein